MILGFLLGIAVAYVLAFFHIDAIIISGVEELIKLDIGDSGYYLLMGLVGGISRVMIGGFITGLVIAKLFTFIKLDLLIIQGVHEWFKVNMGIGGYYLLLAIIGAAVSLIDTVRMFLSSLLFYSKKK